MTIKHKRAGRIGGKRSTPSKRSAAQKTALARWRRGGFRRQDEHRAARWGQPLWSVVRLPDDDGASVDMPSGIVLLLDAGRKAAVADRGHIPHVQTRAGIIRFAHDWTSRTAAYNRIRRIIAARGPA